MGVVLALLLGVWLLQPTFSYAQAVSSSPQPVRSQKNAEDSKIKVPEEILRIYVGAYEAEPGMILTVMFEDGHLLAQLSGQTTKRQLIAESPTKFFMDPKHKVDVTFKKDSHGNVAGVVMQHHGRPDLHLKRIK